MLHFPDSRSCLDIFTFTITTLLDSIHKTSARSLLCLSDHSGMLNICVSVPDVLEEDISHLPTAFHHHSTKNKSSR